MNKPYKSYNGGKESDGTFQKIINLMPPHDIYIEPFLGNGAIFRKKKHASSSILIDLDAAVIQAWNESFINRPASITLINTDAILWLKDFATMSSILKNEGTRVLIYLDPPYPKDCRRNQQDLYTHEMDLPAHTMLLDVVRSISANVVISSYPNELYNETLKDWNTIEFTAMTRGGLATEKVWYNYPDPDELHDYRYLGNDYRQRELIKAVITRNVAKFKRMPDQHRNAIFEQLKNEQIL